MAKNVIYNEYFTHRNRIPLGNTLMDWWNERMFRHLEKKIGSLKGKRVLEIGVGFGNFAKVAAKAGLAYSAVEMNQKLADHLSKKGFAVTVGTVPPIPLEVRVELIWLSHVLEHSVNHHEARAMLVEIYKKLASGGHLVIICPDYLSWGKYFWNCDWSHSFPTTLRNCSQILRDVGFAEVSYGYHTGTVVSGPGGLILTFLFSLIPHRLLDFLFRRLVGGRTLFYSFMTMFGWRQLFLVAKKVR